MFTSPQMSDLRQRFLAGMINEWLVFSELLILSLGEMVEPGQDRSALGRIAWAARMTGLLVQEKTPPPNN